MSSIKRSILIDGLITDFNGAPFNTDFRAPLDFYRVVNESNMSEEEKSIYIGRLFFGDSIPNDPDLWPFLREFILAGDKEEVSTGPKALDFTQDAGRIFASFMQVYQIDLIIEKMHWHVFLELLRAMPETAIIMRVMDIRRKQEQLPANTKEAKEYNSNLRKLKELYRLEDSTPISSIFGS